MMKNLLAKRTHTQFVLVSLITTLSFSIWKALQFLLESVLLSIGSLVTEYLFIGTDLTLMKLNSVVAYSADFLSYSIFFGFIFFFGLIYKWCKTMVKNVLYGPKIIAS